MGMSGDNSLHTNNMGNFWDNELMHSKKINWDHINNLHNPNTYTHLELNINPQDLLHTVVPMHHYQNVHHSKKIILLLQCILLMQQQ